MQWFQPIECSNTVKKPIICDCDNFEEYGYREDSFKIGLKIENWNSNIFMQAKKVKNNGTPDDALQNHLMIPIYSERLVIELNNEDIRGIQYLPIKILKLNNDCLGKFFIANISNYIEAFDYNKSDYNLFGEDFPNPYVRGKIAGVKKFVLKGEKLDGLDLIRLTDYNRRFFVSERFKDVFERNNFTGYSFEEVELV